MRTYENRVVAFLDILGFKEWIKKSTNEQYFKVIKEAMDYIANVRDERYHGSFSDIEAGYKEVSVFSDSIVISYSQSVEGGLFYILMDLVYICVTLNQKGIFLRGGVTYGKLYHKNHECFGPAMIEAYKIEQNLAKYPRVVVDVPAIQHGIDVHGDANTPEQEIEYLAELLGKDKRDNLYYLDYLYQDQEMDDPNYYYYILYDIKNKVIENLELTQSNKKVFKKYRWFAKYYNDTIKLLYEKSFYKNKKLLIPKKLIKYNK